MAFCSVRFRYRLLLAAPKTRESIELSGRDDVRVKATDVVRAVATCLAMKATALRDRPSSSYSVSFTRKVRDTTNIMLRRVDMQGPE